MASNPLKRAASAAKKRERELEREMAPKEWGVFVWNSANRYPRSAAVKIFKRRSAAERMARETNLVERPLHD